MSELQELEKELREYLEKEPNLTRQDRYSYLMAIFQKHMEFKKLDHVVNYKDYFNLLSLAKNFYTKMKLPVSITRKELEPNDAVHVAMIETFIGYLNKNNLLKRNIIIDYTKEVK
jgi:hypothetical protein